ncbi:MAG: monovalent cation/H+ antiporter subunit D family protein [Desulfovibrio sp.]|nr:MAG: monovalent cation/H+ antiporter subunit D family protein [Desulfovibrio sp.]
MISQQYPALLIIAPLLGAFVVAVLSWVDKKYCFGMAVASLAAATVSSILLLIDVVAQAPEPIVYKLGGWDPPFGISYYVDSLNALVLAVISCVTLVNLGTVRTAVNKEHPGKEGSFYALYLLAVTGHLGMVVTGDAFNLYVLLEIAALSGYALLGMGHRRAAFSTLNYLFMGTIGASFYLLGVGYLYIQTGSLNMVDIAGILTQTGATMTVLTAMSLIFIGVLIKMALFPMHAWLPNAYTHASSPASSLIAPMTTKVMVYVLIRMMLTVFTPDITFSMPPVTETMVWLASAAIVGCALLALSARNLKRMLTYILIAEVGYMVGGAWLGNTTGMTGAVLHIVNDAAMTLVMFLAAACMAYRLKSLDFDDLKGAFSKMPFTMAFFVLGAVAMIGVPPTCGFFSKWYLLLGGVQAGNAGMFGGYVFCGSLILSSLINVVLFFRVFEIAHFEPLAQGVDDHGHPIRPKIPMEEAPPTLVGGLALTAVALVVLGLFTSDIVDVIEAGVLPLLDPSLTDTIFLAVTGS